MTSPASLKLKLSLKVCWQVSDRVLTRLLHRRLKLPEAGILDQVEAPVIYQARDQVRDQIRDQVQDQVLQD